MTAYEAYMRVKRIMGTRDVRIWKLGNYSLRLLSHDGWWEHVGEADSLDGLIQLAQDKKRWLNTQHLPKELMAL